MKSFTLLIESMNTDAVRQTFISCVMITIRAWFCVFHQISVNEALIRL